MIVVLGLVWIITISIFLIGGYKKRDSSLIAFGWILTAFLLLAIAWAIWSLVGFARG